MPKHFEDAPIPDDDPFSYIHNHHPTVFLVCTRSLNNNIVVYDLNVDPDTNQVDEKNPVDAYWLTVDDGDKYRPYRRASGIEHDREEFNFLDRSLAWGYEIRKVGPNRYMFKFKNYDQELTVIYRPNKRTTYCFYKPPTIFLSRVHVVTVDKISAMLAFKNVKQLELHTKTKKNDRWESETVILPVS